MPKGAKKRKQAAVQKKLDQEILNTPSNSPPAGRNEKQSDSSSSSSDSDKDLKRSVDQNEEVLNGNSDVNHDVKDEKERDVIVDVAQIEILESGDCAIQLEVKEIGVEEFSTESAADYVAETVGESVIKCEEVVSVVEQAQVIELPQSRGIGGIVENIAEMEVPPQGHDSGAQAAGYITDRNVIPAGSLERRAKWWNCCGLFEVFMAPKDNAR